MPKLDEPADKEQVPTSPEPVRLTRAAARRLGSVERDTPTTPKRSNSAMSLDVISEDSSSSMRATRAVSKRASPLSPISEKENSKTGTPVRRTRRASVATESPVPQSFRTLRRQNKDFSDTEGSSSTATATSNPNQPRMTRQRTTSKLTEQNVENLNGKSPKSVTFCESPEREKDLIQFPKTPIAEKRKSAEDEQPDTSFEKEEPEKTVIEVEREPQESEKDNDEVDQVVAVREVAEAEKNAEVDDKGGKEEEGGEMMTEETAGSAEAPAEFSKSWSQAVSGQQSNETPIDAFGEKERKEEEEKLKEHAETVAKKNIEYSLVKVFSDDDDDEEEQEDEEEDKDKSEFIDSEAVEVSSDNESMDPEEREYLSQQEIPEQGIDIGSEDTDTDHEDEDEILSDDRDFITFSDAENVDGGEEDYLDELENNTKKVNEKGKKVRKRIIVQDTSSDDEVVEDPAETFENTGLVKFSGTMLREMLEETQAEDDRVVIEADFDEDVVMASQASPEKQKKTTQKTPERKSLSRNLEVDFHQSPASPEKDPMPKEAEVKAKTPEKPEEMDQDEPPEDAAQNEAEPGDNSQSWEDIEDEEEDNNGSKENSNISAVMARCSDFLQKQRDAKAAQKQINMEKKAKKKAAKERKKQLKKAEEEKRAERERLKEELMEQKKREKEAEENQLKNEEIVKETANEEQIPVIPAKSQKSKRDKKLAAEDVFQFQGVQPSEKKSRKDKPQKIISQEVKESVPETSVKKKNKKREMEEEPLGEIQEKPTKKKKLSAGEPAETSTSSSKRLPESLLDKLEASVGVSKKVEGKKKRRAEEDLDRPEKKKQKNAKENIPKSPELVNTPAGMFNVQPIENPFSIQDAKLLKKSRVTKQFEREKKLKSKKPIQEPSAVFPRPTTSWSAAGIFTITDLQPQTRVVEGGGGLSMEFVVTTLEPKRKLGKKSSATSVFDSEAKKPAKGFKEAKLYGNGTARESSTDLMHRRIKKKFVHK